MLITVKISRIRTQTGCNISNYETLQTFEILYQLTGIIDPESAVLTKDTG